MNLVFASHNNHKIEEIQQLLPSNFILKSLNDVGIFEDIPETAETIEGNAFLKANFVYKKLHENCFADDTGLEVEALKDAPGIHSARFAGEHKNSEDNIDKLLNELGNTTHRTAQFKTVICLYFNHKIYEFTGICKGKILAERQGKQGFGYDAIFMPEGYQQSFAELSLEEKNKISHRGLAVKQLVDFLKTAR